MLSIDLPQHLEKRLLTVVQTHYQGNWSAALSTWLQRQEHPDWKTQLLADVTTVQTALDQQGGISGRQIAEAIKHYRQGQTSVGAYHVASRY